MTRPEAEPTVGADEDPVTVGAGAPGSRRRRVRIAAALLVTGLAGTGIAVAVPWGEGGNSRPSKADPSAGTVKVVRTDLSDSRSIDGTLGYGKPQTVKGTGNGIVTWLAPNGTTVAQGQVLYRVDDRPVPVFYGAVPVYRRLAVQNTVGRDVQVIAENLRALRYDIGVQPSPGQVVTVTAPAGDGQDAAPDGTAPAKGSATPGPGTPSGRSPAPRASATGPDRAAPGTGPTGNAGTVTHVRVKSGDGVLTRALTAAIKRWQTAQGAPPTGVIEPGDVAVLSGAVRVDSATAQVGDPVAAPLLKVTSTAKAVSVPVDAAQAGSVKRGDGVTVKLPDGTSAPGKVTDIGTDAEQPANGNGGAAKVTVTVSFSDPGKVKKLDSGPVQVEFVSETRPGVLAVPVAALLALREGGYGLRTADGRVIGVKTGLIAKGMAEISGDGITEGTQVVTSS